MVICTNLVSHLPVAKDIGQIYRLLSVDPSSQLLDQIFEEWNYPAYILEKLRREDFRSSNINSFGRLLKRHIDIHFINEVQKSGLLETFKKMLVDDTITLAMRCYLIARPELVRALEDVWSLNITGDYYRCVEKYRKSYYTRRLENGRDQDNITYAIGSGHGQIVEKLLSQPLAASRVGELIYLACQSGHPEMCQIISRLCSLSAENRRLMGIASGDLEMAETAHQLCRLSPHKMIANFACLSGKIDIVDFYLKLKPDRAKKCIVHAINRGHVDLFLYLRDKYPQLLVAAFQSKRLVSYGDNPQMLELVLNKDTIEAFIRILPHPEELFAKYGNHITSLDLNTLLRRFIHLLDYQNFDLLYPYYLKMERPWSLAIERAVEVESRYFFDRLMAHPGISDESLDDPLKAACHLDGRNYFFNTLLTKFGDQTSDELLGECLRHSVMSSNRDVFDFLLQRDIPTRLKQFACQRSYVLSKIEYFYPLFLQLDDRERMTTLKSYSPHDMNLEIFKKFAETILEICPYNLPLLAEFFRARICLGHVDVVKILLSLKVSLRFVGRMLGWILTCNRDGVVQRIFSLKGVTGWHIIHAILETYEEYSTLKLTDKIAYRHGLLELLALTHLPSIQQILPNLHIEYGQGPLISKIKYSGHLPITIPV